MTYFFLILLYFFVLLIPFRYKSEEYDYFAPNKMFTILMVASSLLFLLAIPFIPDVSNPEVQSVLGTRYLNTLQIYVVHQIIFCVVYYWSFYRFHFKRIGARFFNIEIAPGKLLFLSVIFFLVAIVFAIFFVMSYGGLLGLLIAMQDRAAMYEDNQLTFAVINFCVYIGGAFHIKYMSLTKVKWIQLFANIIIALVVLSMQGGRSPFILYLLSIGVYYNYFIKKINLFSIKLLPVYIGIVIFIVALFMFRTAGVQNISGEESVESQASVFLAGNSYVDIQVLIIDFFERHDFWYGKTYRAITTMLVPRSIYPDKLPIDEGVYIHEMLYNYDNVLGCKYFTNSYPPGTLGAMYANFGCFGIILGAFIFGVFHKYIYQVFLKYKSSTMGYLYSFIIVKFQLTVFYIANLTYTLILLTLMICGLYLFHMNRRVRYVRK